MKRIQERRGGTLLFVARLDGSIAPACTGLRQEFVRQVSNADGAADSNTCLEKLQANIGNFKLVYSCALEQGGSGLFCSPDPPLAARKAAGNGPVSLPAT